jgi:hypothetical protein
MTLLVNPAKPSRISYLQNFTISSHCGAFSLSALNPRAALAVEKGKKKDSQLRVFLFFMVVYFFFFFSKKS